MRSAPRASHQIAGRGLVVVDLGARLRNRLHHGRIARDVARHVRDDGEGGDDLESSVINRLIACRRRSRQQQRAASPQHLAARSDHGRHVTIPVPVSTPGGRRIGSAMHQQHLSLQQGRDFSTG
jgi:hypothetical protein